MAYIPAPEIRRWPPSTAGRAPAEEYVAEFKVHADNAGLPHMARILGRYPSREGVIDLLREHDLEDGRWTALFFYRSYGDSSEDFVQLFFERSEDALKCALILGG